MLCLRCPQVVEAVLLLLQCLQEAALRPLLCRPLTLYQQLRILHQQLRILYQQQAAAMPLMQAKRLPIVGMPEQQVVLQQAVMFLQVAVRQAVMMGLVLISEPTSQ